MNKTSAVDCGGTYGGTYGGETAVSIGSSSYYTTTVATISSNYKTVTSKGYYPNTTNPTATVTLKAGISLVGLDAKALPTDPEQLIRHAEGLLAESYASGRVAAMRLPLL